MMRVSLHKRAQGQLANDAKSAIGGINHDMVKVVDTTAITSIPEIKVPEWLNRDRVEFWTPQDHVDAFDMNPHMSIRDYTDVLDLHDYKLGKIQTVLLLDHFGELGRAEWSEAGDLDSLWKKYEGGVDAQKATNPKSNISAIDPPNRHMEKVLTLKYRQIIKDLIPKAEQGDAAAQFDLALAFQTGSMSKENRWASAKWCERAARQGHAEAQYTLGNLYKEGWGVLVDLERSTHCYGRAAEKGHVEAMYEAGVGYAIQPVWERDMDKSFFWKKEAAEHGHAQAQYSLGLYYAGAKEKDMEKALHWWSKAAEQGHEYAQERIESQKEIVQNQGRAQQPKPSKYILQR